LGSSTRRHSVIGCIGYENANPCVTCIDSSVEKVDVGVGCDQDYNDKNTCAICLECFDNTSGFSCGPQKNIATTECGHTFCLSCLLTNLRVSNFCPLCRNPVEKNVKQVLTPLSYSEGVGLLNHELNGLRVYEDIEQYVQNAIETSTQPNTDGQNVQDVIDNIMNMVTNFGFNLLYDATLHMNGGEEQQMDQEWIVQMYNNDSDSHDSASLTNSETNSEIMDAMLSDHSYDSDSNDSTLQGDSESQPSESSDSDSDGHCHQHENKRIIVLPEVPESMLE
jgi:hypothetical protein